MKNEKSGPAGEQSTPDDHEMTDADLEQVSGGFDPQPEPPAVLQKGSQSAALPAVQKVQKGTQKVWGDPHI